MGVPVIQFNPPQNYYPNLDDNNYFKLPNDNKVTPLVAFEEPIQTDRIKDPQSDDLDNT